MDTYILTKIADNLESYRIETSAQMNQIVYALNALNYTLTTLVQKLEEAQVKNEIKEIEKEYTQT